tara:strand:- start:95 stop:418 length:324 start_codon:yes stop_codon:yes gene_type:complete
MKNNFVLILLNFKFNNLVNLMLILFACIFFTSNAFSKGKIYGSSKTLSKEYTKFENCRLKETLINIKDGQKDGYKCVYKRQGKGKDVTIFQPSAVCQKSFKCKTEIQ